jgi:hypothetical protein
MLHTGVEPNLSIGNIFLEVQKDKLIEYYYNSISVWPGSLVKNVFTYKLICKKPQHISNSIKSIF